MCFSALLADYKGTTVKYSVVSLFTLFFSPGDQSSKIKMNFLSGIICLCLTWLLIQALRVISRSKAILKGLPPGPKPFPLIGNLLELGDKPHKSLAKLSEVHGPIMSLKLGQVTTVVISSAAMAKEVLQIHDQHLSNRTIPDAIRAKRHDEFSLPWIPVSTRWRNLRRICMEQIFSNKIGRAHV